MDQSHAAKEAGLTGPRSEKAENILEQDGFQLNDSPKGQGLVTGTHRLSSTTFREEDYAPSGETNETTKPRSVTMYNEKYPQSYSNQHHVTREARSKTPQPYLEAHKSENNMLFGMKKWKGTLVKRPLSERSDIVRELYLTSAIAKPSQKQNNLFTVGNVVYVMLFGWWISLVYIFLGAFLWVTLVANEYTVLCWDMAGYFLWPFGKYVLRLSPAGLVEEYDSEQASLLPGRGVQERKTRAVPGPAFCVWACVQPVLWLCHGLAVGLCGFLVVYIPMAKIQWKALTGILYIDPRSVMVAESPTVGLSEGMRSSIMMCTYQAANIYYYKYTVEGLNIVLVNLMAFVILSLLFGYIPVLKAMIGPGPIFFMSSLSVIPLAYYIGMAIANISAQSTFAVGAVLNATFGSIVELILYYVALKKGLRKLVKASLTGTLLGTMLFIPGLCMIIGGIKFREQRFNWRSAGVSSALLFVSIAGAYTPSLFQKVHGHYEMLCTGCNETGSMLNSSFRCVSCVQPVRDIHELEDDPIYLSRTRPLIWTCSILLPLAYIAGLIFTLRTHAHIYEVNEEEEEEKTGHSQHGPIWSRFKAVSVLLVSTVLLALIAELVVSNVEPIIESLNISEDAIGLVLVALLPDAAEIINGVGFALQNNIALSIEIGSSIAVQVCMIQVPILVAMSELLLNKRDASKHFSLVFPDMYVFAVFFSAILMNYIFQDGKSDYFQGITLMVIYLIMVAVVLW
eukprot:m.12250 g.12250  ORF g.12250 m.12250 type:complete len:737 (-) comp4622_c0_seq2:734-2944(-)